MSSGAGRYDNLHGDEPEIEATRRRRERSHEEWKADHWDETDKEPEEEPDDD